MAESDSTTTVSDGNHNNQNHSSTVDGDGNQQNSDFIKSVISDLKVISAEAVASLMTFKMEMAQAKGNKIEELQQKVYYLVYLCFFFKFRFVNTVLFFACR